MSQAQFTLPLITVIPGQLITAALWNNEWNNVGTNLNPSGVGGYSDTDTQMQIQTAPYPGSVTSHASSLAGELERIRFQICQIINGSTTPPNYWYQAPNSSLYTLNAIAIPVGGVIDYHSATPPTTNWLLANGQAIGRSAYSALNALYSAASYPFGNGDGSTTFNLPNYQDRISIGVNSIVASAGATAGAQTHTLVDAEMPNTTPVTVSVTDPHHTHTATDSGHSHGVTDPGHTHTIKVPSSGTVPSTVMQTAGANLTSNNSSINSSTTGVSVNSGTANVTNASTGTGITAAGTLGGGNGSHSILNPVIGMYKMIRVL